MENFASRINSNAGGVYNNKTLENKKIAREKLIKNKVLGGIKFYKIIPTNDSLSAVISATKDDCGIIEDYFSIHLDFVRDFDGDGISDLLISGYRYNSSDVCFMGSGNTMARIKMDRDFVFL